MQPGTRDSILVLNFIRKAIVHLIKQVWSLPRSIATALEQRRRRVVQDDLEEERLDRIRRPWKYLGK